MGRRENPELPETFWKRERTNVRRRSSGTPTERGIFTIGRHDEAEGKEKVEMPQNVKGKGGAL